MILRCDICTKEFEITKDNILTKNIDGIKVQYFICEHCGFRYIVSCIDSYIAKEQRRLEKLDKLISITKFIEKQRELRLKANKLIHHMKTHNDRLKAQVLKDIEWWI